MDKLQLLEKWLYEQIKFNDDLLKDKFFTQRNAINGQTIAYKDCLYKLKKIK